MKSRHNPRPKFRDLGSWRPAWVRLGGVHQKAPKTLTGEVGSLKQVRYYPDRPGRIYLTIVHQDAVYVGCLLLDDEGFCEKAFQHLRDTL
jgi:hypothetical protein